MVIAWAFPSFTPLGLLPNQASSIPSLLVPSICSPMKRCTRPRPTQYSRAGNSCLASFMASLMASFIHSAPSIPLHPIIRVLLVKIRGVTGVPSNCHPLPVVWKGVLKKKTIFESTNGPNGTFPVHLRGPQTYWCLAERRWNGMMMNSNYRSLTPFPSKHQ